MPAVPDERPAGDAPPTAPLTSQVASAIERSLVTDATGGAAFLDAAEFDVDELTDAVVRAFGHLAPGAVLTVFSARLPGTTIATLCDRIGVAVVGAIPHPDGGTTFALVDERTD